MLLGAVGLAVAGGVIWRQAAARSSNPPPWSGFVLPDGSRLVIHGATWGTNHVGPPRFAWLRHLPGALREKAVRFFKVPAFQTARTERPELMLWPELQTPAALARGTAVGQRYGLALLDPATGRVIRTSDLPGGLAGVWTRTFPARPNTPEMTFAVVRMQSSSEGEEVVELSRFSLRTPRFRKVPVWTAEPLPTLVTNGALVCEVAGLYFGTGRNMTHRFRHDGTEMEFGLARTNQEPGFLLHSRFLQDGQPAAWWQINRVTLRDAAGNEVATTGRSSSGTLGDGFEPLNFSPVLWPGEVWELTLHARRRSDAPFAEAELLKLGDFTLPPLGETNRTGLSVTRGNLRAEVVEVVRRPALPGERPGYSHRDLSRLRIEVSGLTNGLVCEFVALETAPGTRLRPISTTHSTSGDRWEFDGGFRDLGPDTAKARVILAVQAEREFTFRARPIVLTSNLVLRAEDNGE